MTTGYRFKTDKTWTATMADFRWLFGKMGVTDYHITPYADAQRGHPVAVYFIWNGREVRLETSKWETPALNVRAIYLAVDFLRLNRERGLEDVVQSAYLQIAAPARERDPYEVLGIRPDADLDLAEAAYRSQAKKAHPDTGGSAEAMAALNAAIERVREEKKT